jgi:malate dehydrogenase
VQQRGAAIIKARGASSAASAANAVIGSVLSATQDTPDGDWNSLALCSDGSYGVEAGLISSFPTRCKNGVVEIVQGVELDEFSRQKIQASVAELQEEKSLVKDLLP